MEGDAQHVDRLLHELGGDALGEGGEAPVGGDHVPMLVDHQRRVRHVSPEHQPDRLTHGLHLGVIQRPLAVHRRVSGGEQQLVALPQRHLEALGEVDTISGLGRARPFSTKLTWRAETPASTASPSWLRRRRSAIPAATNRPGRSSSPEP